MVYPDLKDWGVVLGAVALALLLWYGSIDLFYVREDSMEPAIFNGQTLVISKWAYTLPLFRPSRQDVIVFDSPDGKGLSVKRISLLPGDRITINQRGWLQVGKEELFLTPQQRRRLSQIGEVPPGSLLVLGDNPFHSLDSRDYGFIPFGAVRGRVISTIGGGID